MFANVHICGWLKAKKGQDVGIILKLLVIFQNSNNNGGIGRSTQLIEAIFLLVTLNSVHIFSLDALFQMENNFFHIFHGLSPHSLESHFRLSSDLEHFKIGLINQFVNILLFVECTYWIIMNKYLFVIIFAQSLILFAKPLYLENLLVSESTLIVFRLDLIYQVNNACNLCL